LCISKQIKENYNFLGYKKKTILIPLGFDEKIFYLRKKKKNKLLNISYFGRICYQKGLHTLISAVAKLNFDFKLNIDIDQIDDADYFKGLINQCRQNLIFKKIKFIKCDHFTISKYMSISDLIVVPSIYQEQYGRVIQEGVASGSLVIGSNVGAIPEIISDKDLIFERENHEALAILITKLNNKLFYKNKFKKLYNLIMKKRSLKNQVKILIKSEVFK
jgi:glycosyltransferase involved in cell wall biosynthesis